MAVPLTSGRNRRFALAVSLSTGDYSKARLVRDVLPLLRDVKEKLERVIAKAVDA